MAEAPVLLHPLGAAGVLVLVLRPRLATTTILALAALLTVNVIADLGLAQLMAAGRVRGDWELALAFSVVPVIGVVYALALLRTARGTAGVRRRPELETHWSRGRQPCSVGPGRRTASAPRQRGGESPVPRGSFR